MLFEDLFLKEFFFLDQRPYQIRTVCNVKVAACSDDSTEDCNPTLTVPFVFQLLSVPCFGPKTHTFTAFYPIGFVFRPNEQLINPQEQIADVHSDAFKNQRDGNVPQGLVETKTE